MPEQDKARYSYVVQTKDAVQVPFPLAVGSTWDACWRATYQNANAAIQRQNNILVTRGNITMQEAHELVEVQRNGLVRELRKPLAPFGRLSSES